MTHAGPTIADRHARVLAAVEAVEGDPAAGRGLPNAAYTDAGVFAFERDEVLGRTWAALAHAGVLEDFTYVSTAGGAFLEWLEGRTLPGVAALEAG